MNRPRPTTVLFDAGGVLLDLDYAFLKRLLEARHVATTIGELSASESLARTAIDRRVREGGRTSEAWRDYFRILLTRVGAPPEGTEEIVDTLAEAHERVGLGRGDRGAAATVKASRKPGTGSALSATPRDAWARSRRCGVRGSVRDGRRLACRRRRARTRGSSASRWSG
jgi:FMN phosphatase YigB (HAD superfamily)